MTLTRASVPDARNKTRPESPKRSSAAFTAAVMTEDCGNLSFATSLTLIKT